MSTTRSKPDAFAAVRVNSSDTDAHRIIRGHDGPVEIDRIHGTVAKTYLFPEHEAAVATARREVAFASRLRDALAASSGIACPEIISCNFSPPPRVIMGLCPGEPVAALLRRMRRGDPCSTAIAGKIREGLEIYTRLFNEPYYDLCFQNLLYDEATGVLTFLDFGIPDRRVQHSPGALLEASIGNLVGCACYGMVQPAHLFSRSDGHLQVLHEVAATLRGAVSRRQVVEIARATYRRLTEHGSAARRGYYATIGTVMSNACLRKVFAS